MAKFTDLQVLARDTYNKSVKKYSVSEANDAIRQVFKDICGDEWNYYTFMENRYKIFAIIAEIMPAAMRDSLANKFNNFAEFADTAMGDKNSFIVKDNEIYPIYTLARGNGDIERQKLTNRAFSVSTQYKGIMFYDEWDSFMAGKVDFTELVDRANVSYLNHIGLLISDTIYGSYASVATPFKATGAYDAATLAGIIKNVKAATGVETVQIWGDADALSNISDAFGYSDRAKDQANQAGFYANFRDSSMYAIPNAYKPQTTTFAVDSSHVIILPAGEKIVKVAFEGEAFVGVQDGTHRNDRQMEFELGRRCGAAALTVPEGKFGFYKFI
jgi:hypothetical protein